MKKFIEKNLGKKFIATVLLMVLMTGALASCGNQTDAAETNSASTDSNVSSEVSETAAESEDSSSAEDAAETSDSDSSTETAEVSETASDVNIITTVANVTSNGVIDATDMFTDRDMRQNVDLTDAEYITVSDGQDVAITKEGVYVISGSASDVTISIEVTDTEKVQLVLDGADITNEDAPAIYVKNADKVFVTTSEGSESTLSVTGTFTADGETNTDAVIFSKDDLVLNGLGTLNVSSTDNGITSKDDLKITGGTINIASVSDAIEVNNTIAVADGSINISSYKDGFHAEKSDDDTKGSIYICGGTINIEAADDGLHATAIVQVDGGEINIYGAEGIEATYLQFNDGDISISATDDGINASYKSTSYDVVAEFNGGYIYIVMGQGDTDAIDSNGSIYVNGGTLDLYAQSPFDYDAYAEYNGGTILVNGNEINAIQNQMMGGMGGMGGHGGGQPGGGPGFGG